MVILVAAAVIVAILRRMTGRQRVSDPDVEPFNGRMESFVSEAGDPSWTFQTPLQPDSDDGWSIAFGEAPGTGGGLWGGE
jgi:hypothetical protein